MRFLTKCLVFPCLLALILTCNCRTNILQTDSLYFTEDHGVFYTNELAKAQNEIPFTIVLPKYLPSQQDTSRVRLPGFKGPLKSSQSRNIELDITYIIDFAHDTKGIITFSEYNYPMTAPDPALNPREKYIEINDNRLVVEENSSGSTFWFVQSNLYFMVGFDNVSYDEALKVIESMVNN
jgi:hypothetical protein